MGRYRPLRELLAMPGSVRVSLVTPITRAGHRAWHCACCVWLMAGQGYPTPQPCNHPATLQGTACQRTITHSTLTQAVFGQIFDSASPI